MEPGALTLPETSGIRVDGGCLPAPLRPFVREYYEEGMELPEGQVLRMPISATSEPMLNATLLGRVFIDLAGGFHLPPVTIAGPQPMAYAVEISGAIAGFYIHFHPVGPLALLGVTDYSLGPEGAPPLHEMVRPEIAAATRRWSEALLRASSFEERIGLTNRFLMEHQRPITPQATMLQAAVDHIAEAHGDIRVDELARRLGCSVASLRRHFRALGMPPKHYAQVVRFRHAHAYLSTTPGATWADAVARFGYSDQSHLVRAYRRFSGGPPTRWQSEIRAVDRRMGIEELPGGPL